MHQRSLEKIGILIVELRLGFTENLAEIRKEFLIVHHIFIIRPTQKLQQISLLIIQRLIIRDLSSIIVVLGLKI